MSNKRKKTRISARQRFTQQMQHELVVALQRAGYSKREVTYVMREYTLGFKFVDFPVVREYKVLKVNDLPLAHVAMGGRGVSRLEPHVLATARTILEITEAAIAIIAMDDSFQAIVRAKTLKSDQDSAHGM